MLLGVNLAVAAVFMQGCKATKPRGVTPPPPPATPAAQQPAQPAAPKTAVQHDIETSRYTEPSKPIATTHAPPPPPPAATKPKAEKPLPPPEPEYTEYTVQKGDILSRICAKRGIRQRDVLKLNPGLNPNLLYVGKKIRLPIAAGASANGAVKPFDAPKAKAAQKPVAAKEAKADQPKSAAAANIKAPVTKKSAYKPYTGPTKEYVVKNGDQLGKIAYSYGITARALKELNGLPDSNLRIGQKLKVPAEKVKAEEKKPAEAKDSKAEAKKDKDAKQPSDAPAPAPAPAPAASGDNAPAPAPEGNAAAPAPAANDNAAPAPAPEPQAEAAAAPTTYKVKKGEDIVAIAINFGVSPSELIDINDLKTGDTLKEGQLLKLPPGAKLP